MTIKEAREKAGMTQSELAEKLEVKQPQVAAWESGSRSPRPDALQKIADACEVNAEELTAEEPSDKFYKAGYSLSRSSGIDNNKEKAFLFQLMDTINQNNEFLDLLLRRTAGRGTIPVELCGLPGDEDVIKARTGFMVGLCNGAVDNTK